MLDEVLPMLSRLSLTFQQGQMAFASIKGGIEKLVDLSCNSFMRSMEKSHILSMLDLELSPHTTIA